MIVYDKTRVNLPNNTCFFNHLLEENMKNPEQCLTTKQLNNIDNNYPNAIFSRKEALLMLRQGYTYQVVADTLGIAKSSLNEACKQLLPDMSKASAMKALKEEYLLEATHDVLTTLKKTLRGECDVAEDGKLVIPVKDLNLILSTLIDKYQLITGLATSNTKQTVHTGNIHNNIIDITSLETDSDK